MDVVGLKDAAQAGFVRLALAQALEGRFLVAEGLQEGERKLLGIERLLGKGGYGLLDLNGVHAVPPLKYTLNVRLVFPWGLANQPRVVNTGKDAITSSHERLFESRL